MAFASLSDVNVHLPDDKAQVQDGEIENLGIDADRLIRARLAGIVDTDLIALWVDSDSTPEIIRKVSGLLIAAKFYSTLVAEDEADGSAFAQGLYDEAIQILDGIREGNIVIIGVDDVEIDTNTIGPSFWPNDTTDGPYFAMADQWSQMAFDPTPFGSPTQLIGEFSAIEVDTLSFAQAEVAVSRLANYIDDVDLPLRGAERIAREDMKERFETETSPDGTHWFALDPEYARRKQAEMGFEHPILTRTKALREKATKASAWSISGESLWFSTADLPKYWRVHQEGSEGFGVTFHHIGEENVLVRDSPEGSQNLPPRPFIGLSEEAEGKILDLFDIWFSNGLEAATSSFALSSVGTLHVRTPQGRFGERIHF